MARKRKVVEVSKEDVPCDPSETVIKTECNSQEVTCTPEATEDEEAPTRNLRPRKSKCYAEKDSPELPEYEERVVLKAPRRKRRLVSTENEALVNNGREEPKPKPKETEDADEPSATAVPCLAIHQVPDVFQTPDKNELTASLGLQPVSAPPEKTGDDKDKPILTLNKPKKRKKKVVTTPAPIPEVKTEPLEIPPLLADAAQAEPITTEVEKCASTDEAPPPPQPKPKPKRIRKKKPPAPVTTEANDVSAVGPETKEVDVEVKKENDDEKCTENKDESKQEIVKKAVKKSKSKNTTNSKPEPTSDTVPNEAKEQPAGNEQSKEKEEIVKKPAPKRIRNRPSKPKPQPVPSTTIENDSSESLNKTTEDKTEQPAAASTVNKPEPEGMSAATTAKTGVAVTARKPFIRGRKSKLVSSRTAKKDIIHTDEAIDPEDIRGFEHVEKYVPPAGVRLPKFWDSEDEVSDDETTDNFRRIMCGFGTNCRIHEVIRPASEIVRRLKELQNTFGSTRTLPLFKKETGIKEEDNKKGGKDEPTIPLKKPIRWHSDPMFFKFANNLPS